MWDISNSRLARRVHFLGFLVKDSRTRSTVSGDGPGLLVLFVAHKQPASSNFLYHCLIVLSISGSVWYFVQNPRCTVIIDSVLASCTTHKDFCLPENAMFPNYCHLVEKQVAKPWHKTKTRLFTLLTDMFSSPVVEFVSELQTSEIPEGIMKHAVWNL
jgi:hypothetical protein